LALREIKQLNKTLPSLRGIKAAGEARGDRDGRHKEIEAMQAADLMSKNVITVPEDATVQEAAALMIRHGISALPVLDPSGKLAGIVSEGDLMRRTELGTERERSWWLELLTSDSTLASDYVKAHGHKVSDVMTRKLITATPETPLNEIALLLEEHGIKRVPVLDKGKLAGIVSRANLLQALAGLKLEAPAHRAGKDTEIREEIFERLRGAPWRPWLLNVTVKDGVASLWGIANGAEEKAAAGVAAENAPGVVAVNNRIIVRPRNWAGAKPYFSE
jgi:CBS domain-containing protein